MDQFKSIFNYQPPRGWKGLLAFTLVLFLVIASLPPLTITPGTKHFIVSFSLLATWRYGWGLINFIRSVIYRSIVFPNWRRVVDLNTDALMPSKIYLLITSFRIDAETTARVVHAAVKEAIDCNVPTTIVASIVELGDEFLYKDIFTSLNPPKHIELRIVRIAGTGKRDALAHGFRSISRDCPPADSVMAVIDGDTVILKGTLKKCAPFFKTHPKLGALTTDEISEVHGTKFMQLWHNLRFAQRHLLMSSISLSRRVMTLTGRMSMYRTDIVTNPDFIDHTLNDHLEHWRLGRFKFLTGDDKSSLFWVLKNGYEQIYLPDVKVLTIEDAPSQNFLSTSTQLMIRWYGNMLRTNARVLKLGPLKMPFFAWWAFLDQRVSMWTTLAGPTFALFLTMEYGPSMIGLYFVWVIFVRWVMTLILLSARKETSWTYPFLLYFGQIYGSIIKTYVMFRLDRQKWTRQKTKLKHDISDWEAVWRRTSTLLVHIISILCFISLIGLASGILEFPHIFTGILFS